MKIIDDEGFGIHTISIPSEYLAKITLTFFAHYPKEGYSKMKTCEMMREKALQRFNKL